MNLSAEISAGEFLDKITILEIKFERISDADKLENALKKLNILRQNEHFIELACADVKPHINDKVSCNLVEKKSYVDYRQKK